MKSLIPNPVSSFQMALAHVRISWTQEVDMLIRPRLNDYHGLPLRQEDVDFAIPFLDEDIPLYVDPFLLWKSPSQMDNGLHTTIKETFNYLGKLYSEDKDKAVSILIEVSECDEIGLGNSKTRRGKKIGSRLAHQILSTFNDVLEIKNGGVEHFESLQLLVSDFSKDRISDIACNFIKSFLIDFTIQQSETYGIPTEDVQINFFEPKSFVFQTEQVKLPINPTNKTPVLLIPKRWLRFVPWINFDDYFKSYTETSDKLLKGRLLDRIQILEFNRKNFDQVQTYIQRKKLEQKDCKNDPLFSQIPILSSKRKKATILKLPTGKTNNADRQYEDNLCPLLASMLFPEMDFAQQQSRTASGVLIRDLIFYNNTSNDLLNDIYNEYGSRQIIFELKNVDSLTTKHVDQLNRYLGDELGRFGILFTRNKPPNNVFKNTIDLWSGQRKCILVLDDNDLELMCQVYENKQRKPIDVINKKYVEFKRSCPS